MRPRRIGIFGGTFDPVHFGHLRSAEEVRQRHGLDQVLFIPSGSPPHKSKRGVAAAHHRAEMVRLAIAGNRGFRLSTIELDRRGPSYSVDTLRELARLIPSAAFVFVIGLDAFREIATWKDYASLFSLCDFVVTSRPSAPALPSLLDVLPVAAREHFWYQPAPITLRHASGHRIFYQQLTDLDVSATRIREYRATGASIRYLTPRAVERYIERHGLYRRRQRVGGEN